MQQQSSQTAWTVGEEKQILNAHGEQHEVYFSCCLYEVAVINSSNKYSDCRVGKKKSNCKYHEFWHGLPREADASPALHVCRFDTMLGVASV